MALSAGSSGIKAGHSDTRGFGELQTWGAIDIRGRVQERYDEKKILARSSRSTPLWCAVGKQNRPERLCNGQGTKHGTRSSLMNDDSPRKRQYMPDSDKCTRCRATP
eukprot:scaffold198540_cov29-Tisochrysis_lutea.AAC.4